MVMICYRVVTVYLRNNVLSNKNPNNFQLDGWTGHNMNACLMSSLPINAPEPNDDTNVIALSKDEYLSEYDFSGMPLFTDEPLGDDKSSMNLHFLPFLGKQMAAMTLLHYYMLTVNFGVM